MRNMFRRAGTSTVCVSSCYSKSKLTHEAPISRSVFFNIVNTVTLQSFLFIYTDL